MREVGRRTQRVRFKQPVRVVALEGAPRVIRTVTANISLKGLFVRMPDPLPEGTRVALALEAAGRVLAFAEGQVAWCRPVESQLPGRYAGAGVRFTRYLHPGAEGLVRYLVDNLDRGRPLTLAPRRRWLRRVKTGAALVAVVVLAGAGVWALAQWAGGGGLAALQGGVPAVVEAAADGVVHSAVEPLSGAGVSASGVSEVVPAPGSGDAGTDAVVAARGAGAADPPTDRLAAPGAGGEQGGAGEVPATAPEPQLGSAGKATPGAATLAPGPAEPQRGGGKAIAGATSAAPAAAEPVRGAAGGKVQSWDAGIALDWPRGPSGESARAKGATAARTAGAASPASSANAGKAPGRGSATRPARPSSLAADPLAAPGAPARRPGTTQGFGEPGPENGLMVLRSGAARALRWEFTGSQLRVSVEGGTLQRRFFLKGPPRMVFDLRGPSPKNTYTMPGPTPAISRVRVGRQDELTRLVLDLADTPTAYVRVGDEVVLSF